MWIVRVWEVWRCGKGGGGEGGGVGGWRCGKSGIVGSMEDMKRRVYIVCVCVCVCVLYHLGDAEQQSEHHVQFLPLKPEHGILPLSHSQILPAKTVLGCDDVRVRWWDGVRVR